MKAAPRAAPMSESSNEARRQENSEGTPRQMEMGKICEKKLSTGTNRENASPIPSPLSVSSSGKRWQSASVKTSPISRKESMQALAASRVNPKRRKLAVNSKAVSNSMTAYRGEIGALQSRHRPRNRIQLSTGKFA